jgi:hypothetical protein
MRRWYEPSRRTPLERKEALAVGDQFAISLAHCPAKCTDRGMCLASDPDATAGDCRCFKVG